MANADEFSRTAFRNVRRWREARGWTREELAAKLQEAGGDVTGYIIANQENRPVSRMPIGQAVALCRLFKVTLDELVDENPCAWCGNLPLWNQTCGCGRKGVAVNEASTSR